MKTRMNLAATAAGFIGTGAVEDYHATHVEHLNDELVAGNDGFFFMPSVLDQPVNTY
jgi:hypothetical protein